MLWLKMIVDSFRVKFEGLAKLYCDKLNINAVKEKVKGWCIRPMSQSDFRT